MIHLDKEEEAVFWYTKCFQNSSIQINSRVQCAFSLAVHYFDSDDMNAGIFEERNKERRKRRQKRERDKMKKQNIF